MPKSRKPSAEATTAATPPVYRPPSPARMIRMGAEHAASMAMDAHPKIKRMKNAIASAVEGTIKQHLGPMRTGRYS